MMEDRLSGQFDLKQRQTCLETNSLIMGMWVSETVNMGSEQTMARSFVALLGRQQRNKPVDDPLIYRRVMFPL